MDPQAEAESVEIVVRTYQFALRVVKLCKHVAGNARFDGPIANQLLRSGTSVGAMVEEAQSAESRADFRHKLAIAAKESRETLYWLRLCKDAEIVEAERISPLIQEATDPQYPARDSQETKGRPMRPVVQFEIRNSQFEIAL